MGQFYGAFCPFLSSVTFNRDILVIFVVHWIEGSHMLKKKKKRKRHQILTFWVNYSLNKKLCMHNIFYNILVEMASEYSLNAKESKD